MRAGLTMVAVLALATAANALNITAVDDGGVPVAGLAGYSGYTVSLVTDTAGQPAGAWDGGFFGPMNQIKAFGALSTPTMTNAAFLAGDIGKDSHFLLTDAQIIVPSGGAPTEDGGAVAPGSLGTFLTGIFAIDNAARQDTLPFAYLVIPDGQQVHMLGGTSDPAGQTLFPIDLWIGIPEPASLILLGLGGLGVLVRRRR